MLSEKLLSRKDIRIAELQQRINHLENLLKLYQTKDKFSIIERVAKPKPSVVHFYRFHRPLDFFTGRPSQDEGVTLSVRLDYQTKQAVIGFSVCSGDNFDKAVGKQLAYMRMMRGQTLVFSVDDISESGLSIKDFLAEELAKDPLLGARLPGIEQLKYQLSC